MGAHAILLVLSRGGSNVDYSNYNLGLKKKKKKKNRVRYGDEKHTKTHGKSPCAIIKKCIHVMLTRL